ncbi:hypothetical protein E3N88_14289 [Mikania micrantha]|uniref:Uncharacterized protein n=1 Tax=Mikania micrantha TaxID=192012 RepID=A0A5N6P128_9ASTR|nr:hypothetical protein E3N88_14289 [Mikania micrantha]
MAYKRKHLEQEVRELQEQLQELTLSMNRRREDDRTPPRYRPDDNDTNVYSTGGDDNPFGRHFREARHPLAACKQEYEEVVLGPDEGDCLVVRRVLNGSAVTQQREAIFRTRCQPWLFDRKVVHDGYKNTYSFDKDGRKITLLPFMTATTTSASQNRVVNLCFRLPRKELKRMEDFKPLGRKVKSNCSKGELFIEAINKDFKHAHNFQHAVQSLRANFSEGWEDDSNVSVVNVSMGNVWDPGESNQWVNPIHIQGPLKDTRFLWKREARRSCAIRTTSIKPNLGGDGNDIPRKLVHRRDRDGDENDKTERDLDDEISGISYEREEKGSVVAVRLSACENDHGFQGWTGCTVEEVKPAGSDCLGNEYVKTSRKKQ